MPGFERGRNLDKIGLKAQDTAELFFDDVRVPAANLLGEEGRGFGYLMERLPQERLAIAGDGGRGRARRCSTMTLDYVQGAHGVRPADRVVPAHAVRAGRDGHRDAGRAGSSSTAASRSSAPGGSTITDAAMAKWWTTELQKRVADQCLQLHGGYGYMAEYPISRACLDARASDDLRRHHRDHEGDHRAFAGSVTPDPRRTRRMSAERTTGVSSVAAVLPDPR